MCFVINNAFAIYFCLHNPSSAQSKFNIWFIISPGLRKRALYLGKKTQIGLEASNLHSLSHYPTYSISFVPFCQRSSVAALPCRRSKCGEHKIRNQMAMRKNYLRWIFLASLPLFPTIFIIHATMEISRSILHKTTWRCGFDCRSECSPGSSRT